MGLEPIPPELKKYSERFIVGTRKSDITGVIFIVIAVLTLKIAFLPFKLRIVLAVLVVIFGAIFIFAKLDEKIKDILSLKKSFKNVSYYDPLMDSFIPITEIKNNVVEVMNSQNIGVIKVEPIDLEILDYDEQEEIISAFLKFLSSLENQFMVVSPSKPVNIDNWLFNLETKITANKKKNRFLQLQQHKVFETWIKDFISKSNVRDRAFYIVLSPKQRIELKSFKEIFGKKEEKRIIEEESMSDKIQKLVNELNNSIARLKATTVDARQLNNNELLTLYASFFSDQNIVDEHFTSPITFPEREVDYL